MAEGQCIERFKSQPRLPGFAIPRRYDLFLRPDLSSCRFAGSVQIVVDVVDDTRFLILNAADLAIDGGSVWFRNPSSSKVILNPLATFFSGRNWIVRSLDCLRRSGRRRSFWWRTMRSWCSGLMSFFPVAAAS
ncbi:hypothetical protein GW17_00045063 [Ensete ventricosum]|nr:hypothetical protein GW17_00045063 [Ensete ventricosum]